MEALAQDDFPVLVTCQWQQLQQIVLEGPWKLLLNGLSAFEPRFDIEQHTLVAVFWCVIVERLDDGVCGTPSLILFIFFLFLFLLFNVDVSNGSSVLKL